MRCLPLFYACALVSAAAVPLVRAQEGKDDPTARWPAEAKELAPCLAQLTDADPKVRKQAAERLLAAKNMAFYPLREGRYSEDGTLRRRAEVLYELLCAGCPDDLRKRTASMAMGDPSMEVKDRKKTLKNLVDEQPYWVVPVLEALAVLDQDANVRDAARRHLADIQSRMPLAVELSATSTSIRPGEKPEVTIILKNTGRRPMDVFKPVDGSFCPSFSRVEFRWEVHRRKDAYTTVPIRPKRFGACGTLDGIHLSSLETLKPRASFSFKAEMGLMSAPWMAYVFGPNFEYTFDQPGEYEITLVYRYDAGGKRGLPQNVDANVRPRLEKIPGFFKRSKPLRIKVASD